MRRYTTLLALLLFAAIELDARSDDDLLGLSAASVGDQATDDLLDNDEDLLGGNLAEGDALSGVGMSDPLSELGSPANQAATPDLDPLHTVDPHEALWTENCYPSAETCRACHPSQYEEWRASGHAYASISPMYNRFEQAITEYSRGTVGSFCIRCHSPVGTQLKLPRTASLLEAPPVVREGVTCIACHRVREHYWRSNGDRRIEPGNIHQPIAGTSNGASLAHTVSRAGELSLKTSPDQTGPGQPIHNSSYFFEPLTNSDVCVSCHQVAVHPGIGLEVVHAQYRAGPAAAKGITCQQCHMGAVPGKPDGYEYGHIAEITGKPFGEVRKKSNHMFWGPGYSIAHPGVFPHNPDAKNYTPRQWTTFDYRAGWGTDEFESTAGPDEHFPAPWDTLDDRRDGRRVIDANLRKLDEKRASAIMTIEASLDVEGPLFYDEPRHGKGLTVGYRVSNKSEGHNMPSGSLGAQPQLWLNVVLINPDGQRVWETGYLDRNADLADMHSTEVARGNIARDKDLFNLQTKFLINNVRGTDREAALPFNFSIDQLVFLRPGAVPVSVLNHPPLIRMEAHSIAPLDHRTPKFHIPAAAFCKKRGVSLECADAQPNGANVLHAANQKHTRNDPAHERKHARSANEQPNLHGQVMNKPVIYQSTKRLYKTRESRRACAPSPFRFAAVLGAASIAAAIIVVVALVGSSVASAWMPPSITALTATEDRPIETPRTRMNRIDFDRAIKSLLISTQAEVVRHRTPGMPKTESTALAAGAERVTEHSARLEASAVGSQEMALLTAHRTPPRRFLKRAAAACRSTTACSSHQYYSDFSPTPISNESMVPDPGREQWVYDSKQDVPTQHPWVEWGRIWYGDGITPRGKNWFGTKNLARPKFYVYGDYRSGIAGGRNAEGRTDNWAARLNLDFDLQLTDSDRFHMFINTLENGGQNTRWIYEDDNLHFHNEIDLTPATGFYEGDLGVLIGAAQDRTSPMEIPFTAGLVPLLFQNGIWMEDAATGVAFALPARHSRLLNISNYDASFFAIFDQLNSDAFAGDEHAAQAFGTAWFIEAYDGYIESGYAYVRDRNNHARSYHNITASYTRRYFDRISNSVRVIVNTGQDGPAASRTADGALLLVENSWITQWPLTVVPYANMFVGWDRPQSVARAAISGGILRNTGINFDTDALNGLATLDTTASDTAGGSIGIDLIGDDLDRQLLLELTYLTPHGSKNLAVPDDQFAAGARYQFPISNATLLRFDTMYGWRRGLQDVYGTRMEYRWKF